MTIKELKKNILLSLYHRYKENKSTSIGLKDLCTQDNLVYDSLKQVADAAQGLKDDGYIKLTLLIGGDGQISKLTPNGIEYIEENLLSNDEIIEDGLRDTTKTIEAGANFQLDVNNEDIIDKSHTKEGQKAVNYFIAKEKYKPIIDTDATPCFGVDSIADCYAKQLDKIALSKTESTRMLGIFGPWGRGKTFFFKRLKKNLEDKTKHSLEYKIVEFNAWKYQETPALWAYMYKSIYDAASRTEKFIVWLRQVWKSLLTSNTILYLVIFVIGWCIGWIVSLVSDATSQVLYYIKVPASAIYLFSGIACFLKENTVTARNIVSRYTQKKSYKSHLGVQNEIEEDLQSLVHSMANNPRKSRVILYVDDIDRCSSQKMSGLIEALKTILENPIIQERLIVICSIDENKLLKAYSTKIEAKGYGENDAKKLSREQLDKLFLFGVKLAALDTTQLEIYLRSLVDDSNSDENSVDYQKQRMDVPFSVFRRKNSLVAISGNKEAADLNDENIINLFHDFLINHTQEHITPRKIRIMYYQLLFGLSLSSKGGGAFTDTIVEDMLKKSLGLHYDEDIDSSLSDIIEMAVPY